MSNSVVEVPISLLNEFDELVLQRKYEELLKLAYENDKYPIAKYYQIDGFFRLDRLNEGLETALRHLNTIKNKADKETQARFYNRLGAIYASLGFLDSGLIYYEKSLKINRNFNFHYRIAGNLLNIGIIYQLRGDWEEAIENFEGAQQMYLPYTDTNSIINLSLVHANISQLYIELGEFDKAVENSKIALELGEQTGIPEVIGGKLCLMIDIFSKLNQRDQIKVYFDQLTTLAGLNKTDEMDLIFLISKALYLKSSDQFFEKFGAQPLFEKAISRIENYPDIHDSKKHLIELYLIELHSTGSSKILDKIKRLLTEMQNSARSQNMIPKLIETNILKTKLFMVEGRFDESYKLLEGSHLLSKQQNLKYWSTVIQSEKDRFQIEIKEMENLFTLSSSLRQRLKKSDIFDYFQQAKKMVLESEFN